MLPGGALNWIKSMLKALEIERKVREGTATKKSKKRYQSTPRNEPLSPKFSTFNYATANHLFRARTTCKTPTNR